MSGKYDDIIGLSRPVSDRHPRMSLLERAAQFSPFAALTGYGDAVEETARLTERKRELDETEREILDWKLLTLARLLEEKRSPADHKSAVPGIRITFFLEDEKKSGGAYETRRGTVTKLDWQRGTIVMDGGIQIPADDVVKIEGPGLDF